MFSKDFNEHYKSESVALVETSKCIISDAIRTNSSTNTSFKISEVFIDNPVLSIDENCCIILKNLFGYEKSRQLIVDSELPLDSESAIHFVHKAFGLQSPIKKPISILSYLPSSIHDNFGSANLTTKEQLTMSIEEKKSSPVIVFEVPIALQMVIYDNHTGTNFKYDTTSGQSVWIKNDTTNYGDTIDYNDGDEYSEIECNDE